MVDRQVVQRAKAVLKHRQIMPQLAWGNICRCPKLCLPCFHRLSCRVPTPHNGQHKQNKNTLSQRAKGSAKVHVRPHGLQHYLASTERSQQRPRPDWPHKSRTATHWTHFQARVLFRLKSTPSIPVIIFKLCGCSRPVAAMLALLPPAGVTHTPLTRCCCQHAVALHQPSL